MALFPLLALLCAVASAAPSGNIGATLSTRQAGDACPVGYCTQNGGTTGGAGGDTVTVTDVNGLVEAADSDGPLTIVVSGSISGSAKVRVGSDKTIFGEPGSCKSLTRGVEIERFTDHHIISTERYRPIRTAMRLDSTMQSTFG
jgi:pectate lyase